MNTTHSIEQRQILVRKATSALVRCGLLTAYGHCSSRIDEDSFLVSAPKAPSTIVPGDKGILVDIDGALPEGALGEVRAHQQIYKRRPEIGGIVRFISPRLLSLSTLQLTPKVRHGFGAYFAPHAVLWDDPALIRTDQKATRLAEAMGSSPAIVMRGNGAITGGETLEQAVALAWFLEDAARVELDVLSSGQEGVIYSSEQAQARAVWDGGVVERLWNHLTFGDPE